MAKRTFYEMFRLGRESRSMKNHAPLIPLGIQYENAWFICEDQLGFERTNQIATAVRMILDSRA